MIVSQATPLALAMVELLCPLAASAASPSIVSFSPVMLLLHYYITKLQFIIIFIIFYYLVFLFLLFYYTFLSYYDAIVLFIYLSAFYDNTISSIVIVFAD